MIGHALQGFLIPVRFLEGDGRRGQEIQNDNDVGESSDWEQKIGACIGHALLDLVGVDRKADQSIGDVWRRSTVHWVVGDVRAGLLNWSFSPYLLKKEGREGEGGERKGGREGGRSKREGGREEKRINKSIKAHI